MRVSVYCASSTKVSASYKREAYELGRILSEEKVACNYGGGSVGLMGELAQAMLDFGGSITGIIPQFMVDQGWDNPKVETVVVNTMHERKQRMVKDADAAIAMPGGIGTFEELLEVITWKQLGLFLKPIVILNVDNYYGPMLAMLEKAVDEQFMRREHLELVTVVSSAAEVIPAIRKAAEWSRDEALSKAAL
ncbi:MAG: TIGR00730 family Rossman fold protein [Paludibacteraceae bacterium]|nr:TIGR00730 family Rossman fold protein [Paludibacteraceae bacterium]